jgi:hypothetical protein
MKFFDVFKNLYAVAQLDLEQIKDLPRRNTWSYGVTIQYQEQRRPKGKPAYIDTLNIYVFVQLQSSHAPFNQDIFEAALDAIDQDAPKLEVRTKQPKMIMHQLRGRPFEKIDKPLEE